MRIAELLFGILFTCMALWGVVSGEVYVFSGKAEAASNGDGGWASFGEHPVIFLLVWCLYLFCGVGLIRDGLKGDE